MPIETLLLDTMDGLRLEADLALPERIAGAVAICHPHPQFGGDRFNVVVDALFGAFPAAGYATVRFDFRGVNASEGRHGGGVDERMDALAALELIEPFAGRGPLVLVGYSFGALVALDVAHPRLDAWLAIAPPLGMTGAALVAARDPRPKLLLVPANDQFSPPTVTATQAADWLNVTQETIDMADHFLAGRTAAVAARAVAFVSALVER